MDKQNQYTEDGGSNSSKKKKKVPSPFKALKKFKKENPNLDTDLHMRIQKEAGLIKEKKKKTNANLTDEEIEKKAKKRADKKMDKALKSFGTDKYVPGAMPEEYYANKDKARERLKKKRAGTGNHPMNK